MDGHVHRPGGRLLIGARYAGGPVGTWDDGGGVVYFDQRTRVILAREVTNGTATYAGPVQARRLAGVQVNPQKAPPGFHRDFVKFDQRQKRFRYKRMGFGPPEGSRRVSADLSLSADDEFMVTHPDTGQRIVSGRLASAPLNEEERDWERTNPPPVAGGAAGRLKPSEREWFNESKSTEINVGPAKIVLDGVANSLLRHHVGLGWIAVIDPGTNKVRRVTRTPRLDGESLPVHPPVTVRVSAGGSVAHPDTSAGRIYVGDDLVGQGVTIESTVDGIVVVSDAAGRALIRRRFASLVTGEVIPGEADEVSANGAAGAQTVTVAADGYLYRPSGRLLVGSRYAGQSLGIWDDGTGLRFFDVASRVVLLREATDGSATYAPAAVVPAPGKGPTKNLSMGFHLGAATVAKGKSGYATFKSLQARVPAGLRPAPHHVTVTDDGAFMITHPDTGQPILSGRLEAAPRTTGEQETLRTNPPPTRGEFAGDLREGELEFPAGKKQLRITSTMVGEDASAGLRWALAISAPGRGTARIHLGLGWVAFLDEDGVVRKLTDTVRIDPPGQNSVRVPDGVGDDSATVGEDGFVERSGRSVLVGEGHAGEEVGVWEEDDALGFFDLDSRALLARVSLAAAGPSQATAPARRGGAARRGVATRGGAASGGVASRGAAIRRGGTARPTGRKGKARADSESEELTSAPESAESSIRTDSAGGTGTDSAGSDSEGGGSPVQASRGPSARGRGGRGLRAGGRARSVRQVTRPAAPAGPGAATATPAASAPRSARAGRGRQSQLDQVVALKYPGWTMESADVRVDVNGRRVTRTYAGVVSTSRDEFIALDLVGDVIGEFEWGPTGTWIPRVTSQPSSPEPTGGSGVGLGTPVGSEPSSDVDAVGGPLGLHETTPSPTGRLHPPVGRPEQSSSNEPVLPEASTSEVVTVGRRGLVDDLVRRSTMDGSLPSWFALLRLGTTEVAGWVGRLVATVRFGAGGVVPALEELADWVSGLARMTPVSVEMVSADGMAGFDERSWVARVPVGLSWPESSRVLLGGLVEAEGWYRATLPAGGQEWPLTREVVLRAVARLRAESGSGLVADLVSADRAVLDRVVGEVLGRVLAASPVGSLAGLLASIEVEGVGRVSGWLRSQTSFRQVDAERMVRAARYWRSGPTQPWRTGLLGGWSGGEDELTSARIKWPVGQARHVRGMGTAAGVRLDADGWDGTIPELVTPLLRVFDDEIGGADPEATFLAMDELARPVREAQWRDAAIGELFAPFGVGEEYAGLPVARQLSDHPSTQHTFGWPPELLRSLIDSDMGAAESNVQVRVASRASVVGGDVSRLVFGDGWEATARWPGEAVAGQVGMLYIALHAQLGRYREAPWRLKADLLYAVRVAADRLFEALPREVRLSLTAFREPIWKLLIADYRREFARYIWGAGAGPWWRVAGRVTAVAGYGLFDA